MCFIVNQQSHISEGIKFVPEQDSDYMVAPAGKEQKDRMLQIQPEQAPKVLIVEDNAELRDYLRENLSPQYIIIDAGDGKEGLKKALKDAPDLIISDIMMPVMDGIEMTRKFIPRKKGIQNSQSNLVTLCSV